MKKQKEGNKEKTEKTLPGPAQRAERRERDGDPSRKERELGFSSMPQPYRSVAPGHSYLALDASVPRLTRAWMLCGLALVNRCLPIFHFYSFLCLILSPIWFLI
jgi:hypothetical protein